MRYAQYQGWSIVYFGFKEKLKAIASQSKLSDVTLSLNVDGLPLFKSSTTSPWPKLRHVTRINAEFLTQTCEELSELLVNGIVTEEGKQLNVKLSCVMADALARSLVKCTKTFRAYYGCDKCAERGIYTESYVRILKTKNLQTRTDETFRNQLNAEHHNGQSPFLNVPNIDMIRSVPIDYMHSVLLGVMEKLLQTWTKGSII